MTDYEVAKIFQEIEDQLISSMRRNFENHKKWEKASGFDWPQWQSEKLMQLRKYRNQNAKIMRKKMSKLAFSLKNDLLIQFLEGGTKVDKEVTRALSKGYKLSKSTPSEDFFKGNNKKLDALIKSLNNDLEDAEHAALRMMDDVYRRTIVKAELFLGSGAATFNQAVDMATKDFLSKGLTCITYSDGRKVNIASYARMAVRTANKRVYLMGEGERRKEWGISTVLISQYLLCSDLCLPWQGKVFIDDVYSGGKAGDGSYPLLSTAIQGHLFHPNCKHTSSTYFEGINEVPEPLIDETSGYEKAQREMEINRNIQKYKRLKKGSLDPANIQKYDDKIKEWERLLVTGGKYQPKKISDTNDTTMYTGAYNAWNKTDKLKLANDLLVKEGLPVSCNLVNLSEFGNCRFSMNTAKIDLLEYNLKDNDIRSMDYQVKTLFHELFHAKAHGLEHDIGKITFKEWAYVDDVYAECTGHYLARKAGIMTELSASYPDYLIEALPKLKALPEFKNCKTIVEFGEVMFDSRFGKKPNAKWTNMVDELKKQQYNVIKYSKPYLQYMEDHKEELVDKFLENSPQYIVHKQNMMNDLDQAIIDVKNGTNPSANFKYVFDRALLSTMDRLGVN